MSNNKFMPDVGQECEISNCGNPFEWCVIKYLGEQLIVVDHKSHIDQHYQVGSFVLRPIKSEAEKHREVMIDSLSNVFINPGEYVGRQYAEAIVDAGWIKPNPLTDDVIDRIGASNETFCGCMKKAEAYIRGETL